MQLNSRAREFYTLTITTTPAVAAWEASFDGGTTWFAGTPSGSSLRWLVAGRDATVGTAVAQLQQNVTLPLVRATDTPEVLVRGAPSIRQN